MEVLQLINFEPRWIVSKIAPEVRFYIEPLIVPLKVFCTTNNLIQTGFDEDGKAEFVTNLGGESIDMVRIGCREIEGLTSNGEPFKLEFTKENIGSKFRKVITHECIAQLPEILLWEISSAIRDANQVSVELKEKLKNTPDSSSVNSPVPATSEPAPAVTTD